MSGARACVACSVIISYVRVLHHVLCFSAVRYPELDGLSLWVLIWLNGMEDWFVGSSVHVHVQSDGAVVKTLYARSQSYKFEAKS